MARKPNTPKATRRNGDDYEIGYRRPPKASQWSRGQSGNPSGRPKKRKTLGDFIQEVLDEEMVVETKDGGRRRMKKGRVLAEKQVVLSGRGNASATKAVWSSDARRASAESVDMTNPFDPEAPLTDDERDIANAAMDYMMRGLDEISAAIDHHFAERDGRSEDKS